MNEIFEMMEQFGPFNFLFTLSSAEMKWPEVNASILHTIGEKISYEKGWETNEDLIKIDGVPLSQYWEKNRNKSKYFKKNFLLITRIFDNMVKAFVKHLLANKDVENFSYHIEFQIRGMPHAHGVFWLRKDIIESIKDGDDFNDEKVVKLIDKWITCSLDTGDPALNKLVSEVNVQKHTKSCQKGKSKCRFNFPRLPSKTTLIASPLVSNLSEEEREKEISDSVVIVEKVKTKLSELSDDDIEVEFKNDIDLFLEHLGITYEAYEKALRISEREEKLLC